MNGYTSFALVIVPRGVKKKHTVSVFSSIINYDYSQRVKLSIDDFHSLQRMHATTTILLDRSDFICFTSLHLEVKEKEKIKMKMKMFIQCCVTSKQLSMYIITFDEST